MGKYLEDMIIGLLRLIGIVGIGGGLVYLGLGVYGYIVSVDDIRPIIEWPSDRYGLAELVTQRKALPLIAINLLSIIGGILIINFSNQLEHRLDNTS